MRVLVGKNALLKSSSPAIAGQNLDLTSKSLKISLDKKSQEGSFVLNFSTLCLFNIEGSLRPSPKLLNILYLPHSPSALSP